MAQGDDERRRLSQPERQGRVGARTRLGRDTSQDRMRRDHARLVREADTECYLEPGAARANALRRVLRR